MATPRTRIFSDLHFGDPRSTLRSLEQFTPLFDGADHVILAGDTLDTQVPVMAANLGPVREFFARAGPEVVYLSGNHDPDISPHAEWSLCDGRVWVTHGDAFFDLIAPWSHHRPDFARRLSALYADVPPDQRDRLETRFRLNRIASRALPEPHWLAMGGTRARLRRLWRTFFPPTRLLTMLRSWQTVPAVAAARARAERPKARVIIFGHTHFPGVWRPRSAPGLTVINTGSFNRPFGGLLVEIVAEKVSVYRIDQAGGRFVTGRRIHQVSLFAD
jgi:predicted phosphodiesterase